MPEQSVTDEILMEDDAFSATQSLEEELFEKGYMTSLGSSLGSSLAAEIQSATHVDHGHTGHMVSLDHPERLPPNAIRDDFKESSHSRATTMSLDLQSVAVGHVSPSVQEGANGKLPRGITPLDLDDVHSSHSSPVLSPVLAWSLSNSGIYGISRRSSFASTWSASGETEEEDPFALLERQLEELNSAMWETKTLHKRLFNTLQLHSTHATTAAQSYSPPLELVATAVISLVESKSRDRERQISYLNNISSTIRKESGWMTTEAIEDLDNLIQSMAATLYDVTFAYENPLPVLHSLKVEGEDMALSLEELKEHMYVNKRQIQELNSRLRSITKTVSDVRKDLRRINKLLEDKDDDDTVVLEKGEAAERAKHILWGLDDLDAESSRQLESVRILWQETAMMDLF